MEVPGMMDGGVGVIIARAGGRRCCRVQEYAKGSERSEGVGYFKWMPK